MFQRNASVEPTRCMQFKIGVNQGDVISDGVRVYGDGVNIAARLEALAQPGEFVFLARSMTSCRGSFSKITTTWDHSN